MQYSLPYRSLDSCSRWCTTLYPYVVLNLPSKPERLEDRSTDSVSGTELQWVAGTLLPAACLTGGQLLAEATRHVMVLTSIIL